MANDEKPTKKGREALYDHESSKKARGEKTDAPKGGDDEMGTLEDKKEKKKLAPGSEEPAKAAAEGGEEGGEGMGGEKPHEKFLQDLKDMHERHRTERRDAHGNYKSQLDQMHKRHMKEIEDHMAGAQQLGMAEGGEAEEKPAAAPKVEGGEE